MDSNDPSMTSMGDFLASLPAAGTRESFQPPRLANTMDVDAESLVPSFNQQLHIQTKEELSFLPAARQPSSSILTHNSLESVKMLMILIQC